MATFPAYFLPWNPEVSRSQTSVRQRGQMQENLWVRRLGPLNA